MKSGRFLMIVGLASVLIVAGCAQSNVTPTLSSSDVTLTLRVEPDPPAVGSSTLTITLKDSKGAPVNDARLSIHADMDHAGMMPIDAEVSSGINGDYSVPLAWSMGGGWIVLVTAILPGGSEVSRSFDFLVGAVSSESIIKQGVGKATLEPAMPDMNMTEGS